MSLAKCLVIEQGNLWVIARNFQTFSTGADKQTRHVYDVWTGKDWSPQRGFAMTFKMKEDAEKYLEENREVLEC
jgi:hypothetical protein